MNYLIDQSDVKSLIEVAPLASFARPRVKGRPLPVPARRPLTRPAAKSHALAPGRPFARPATEPSQLGASSLDPQRLHEIRSICRICCHQLSGDVT